MENNEAKNGRNNRLFWIVLIGLVTVSVSLLTGMAGYAIGQSTTPAVSPPAELAPVEVTREVQVVVTAVPQPTVPEATPVPAVGAEVGTAVTDTLDLALFDEVWNHVQEDFDGSLPASKDLTYGAIEGSLATLDDQFTSFIRPELAALLREDMAGWQGLFPASARLWMKTTMAS
ncbi:MAG: hypothetical protein P8183_08015 [Anaerolineae bacterium]